MKKLIVLLLVLTACTTRNVKVAENQLDSVSSKEKEIKNEEIENSKSYENLDFAKTNNKTDTSTFIIIDKTIAIIIYPDTTWINKQQKEIGEDGWNEIVADHDYYQAEAMTVLENKGIEVKFINSDKQFYKFIKSDKSIYCIDKAKMKDKWGLILFNTDKDPVFWLDTSIDEAMKDIYLK